MRDTTSTIPKDLTPQEFQQRIEEEREERIELVEQLRSAKDNIKSRSDVGIEMKEGDYMIMVSKRQYVCSASDTLTLILISGHYC